MVRNSWATRGIQRAEQWAATPKGGANLKIRPWFGLRVATHPHEDGMASNRVSLTHGECVPAPCTHRPSSHPSVLSMRTWFCQVRIGGT